MPFSDIGWTEEQAQGILDMTRLKMADACLWSKPFDME
jgi:hypothetical protein